MCAEAMQRSSNKFVQSLFAAPAAAVTKSSKLKTITAKFIKELAVLVHN